MTQWGAPPPSDPPLLTAVRQSEEVAHGDALLPSVGGGESVTSTESWVDLVNLGLSMSLSQLVDLGVEGSALSESWEEFDLNGWNYIKEPNM
ncbi:hypothetical protein DY000_02038862 [Brassica cretica]|uniref:Dof-type domain-containing protein n=1 Tax=Brassica cretica TaxID=69181 RepID=A0ABQ7BKR6_BRACR|nr:hypothetical protein DY000_02038862 [Brassica cretica]